MSRSFASLLVAVALAGAGCAARPAPARPVHRFEQVSFAEPANPEDPAAQEEPCLYGSYAPGTPVLLLSDDDAATCAVTTGRVGVQALGNGPCTILAGRERCRGGYALGVIGSGGAYRRVEPRPVGDEAIRRKLGQAISSRNVVDTASRRWKDALQGVSLRASIADAVSWPELDGAPVLVRLTVDGDAEGGPWVAVSNGEVGAMAGPFSFQLPRGFVLDGRSYLSIPVAVCTSCGGVGMEVHEVVGGRLRRVLESFANAN